MTEQKAVIYSERAPVPADELGNRPAGLQTRIALINMQICITSLAIQIALPCNVPQNCSTSNIAFDLQSPLGIHNVSIYPDHQAFTEQSALTQLLQQLAFSKPSLVALGRALSSPCGFPAWHPMLLNMVAFRKTSFPWHTGRQAGGRVSVYSAHY